jgi:hypothetical protein
MNIPKRVSERIVDGLKRMRPVIQAQRDRDVSEADTVTVVKDILADVLGFDKYAEITSEHSIRGTYCDLAVNLDGKCRLLLEVKAIGLELNDRHVKQAIDYAANQGVDWVVLTNGAEWVLYHVLFEKPVNKQEIARVHLLTADLRKDADMERIYLLTREGLTKDVLSEYRDRQDATSRFMLAAMVLNSDAVLGALRREVRRVSGMLVECDEIEKALREQVLKREAIEGDQADAARRRFLRKTSASRKDDVAPETPVANKPSDTPAIAPSAAQ